MKIPFLNGGEVPEVWRKCAGSAVRASRGCNKAVVALQRGCRRVMTAAPLRTREALTTEKILTFWPKKTAFRHLNIAHIPQ